MTNDKEDTLETTEVYEQPGVYLHTKLHPEAIEVIEERLKRADAMETEKLRDQFAMAALPIIERSSNIVVNAYRAYDYADAMILARKTPVKTGDKE